MNVDKALAKSSIFLNLLDGGDTGERRVEHRNILQLRSLTSNDVGQLKNTLRLQLLS
jgi:hypothetical protein